MIPKAFKTWDEYLAWLDSFIEYIEKVDQEELKASEYRTLKLMVKDEKHFPNRGYNNIEELI